MTENSPETTAEPDGGTTADPTNDEMDIQTDVAGATGDRDATATPDPVIRSRDLDVFYGEEQALDSIDIDIPENRVTAIIGPSGCGKSTFLRCINRMNDRIDACRVTGELSLRGKNVYDDDVDPVALRRRVGMVFQEPNPFPKSIYDNVAYGLRVQDKDDNLDEKVEQSLKRAALWD